jgi:signal transduction histidine kinase
MTSEVTRRPTEGHYGWEPSCGRATHTRGTHLPLLTAVAGAATLAGVNPQTALEALAWRRLPVSGWPWRSLGYLLATLLAALVAAALLALPAAPWLVLAGGGFQGATIALLILLGLVLVVALGPLIAIPVTATARWRLAIVDRRPAEHARRVPGAGGVAGWLRARYTDRAAWRETGYACLLATVVLAVSIAVVFAVMLAGAFLISPVFIELRKGPVSAGAWHASTLPQSVPFVFAGLVLLGLCSYLVTLVAGADARVSRSLLFSGGREERLRAELTEVAASRARLAGAFEAERRRIERDLHDGAQQKLVALTMQLGLARLDLPPRSAAAQAVTAAHEQAKQLMADLRDLIHGIQPQVLTDLGLPAALSELADQAPVPVTVDSALTGRLPGQAENTAYFAAAEALTNVAKHSGAASASVTARVGDGILVLEVRDDGRGGADPGRGSGLTGLADRVAVAGGRMLLSSPPGGPTVLRVEVPCTTSISNRHPRSG